MFKKNQHIFNIVVAKSALASLVLSLVASFLFISLPATAKEFQLQEIASIGRDDAINSSKLIWQANPSNKSQYFVAARSGKIYMLDERQAQKKAILDLTQDLSQAKILQLSAFALHPNFSIREQQGYATFYTAHTEVFEPEHKATRLKSKTVRSGFEYESVITEWQLNSSTSPSLDSEKKREILRIPAKSKEENIKQLAFDPFQKPWSDDFGLLYIALNGANEPAQPPLYSGTVLRINPVALGARGYSIPANNPFLKNNKIPSEIYLLGLQKVKQLLWSKQNNQALFIKHLYGKQYLLSKAKSGNDWRQKSPKQVIWQAKQNPKYDTPFVIYQGRSYKELLDKALFLSFDDQALKLNSIVLDSNTSSTIADEGIIKTNNLKTKTNFGLHQDKNGELVFSDNNTGTLYYLESALAIGSEQVAPENENLEPEPSQTGSYIVLIIIVLGVVAIVLLHYRSKIQNKITRSTLHKRFARFEYDEESQSIHLFKRHQEEIDNTLRLTDIIQSEILLNGHSISIISGKQGQGFNSSLETELNRVFVKEHRDKMVDNKVRQIDLLLTSQQGQKYDICTYLRKGNQRLTKAGYHETVEKLLDWCWLIAQQLNAGETGKRVIRVKPVIHKQTHASNAGNQPRNKEETAIPSADLKVSAKPVNTKNDAKSNAESTPDNELNMAAKQNESNVDTELVNALDKLVKLKQQGFLSEEEFASAKSKLLEDLLK